MADWKRIALYGGAAVGAYFLARAIMGGARKKGSDVIGSGTVGGGVIPEGGEVPGTVSLIADTGEFIHPQTENLIRGPARDNVWAIVLHQAAVSRGSDPWKYRKFIAHFVIVPDGTVVQLHPIDSYIAASNGLNNGSVSVEFAGNLPAVSQSTDPDDFYKPDKFGMNQLTPAQVEAGRNLIFNLKHNVFPHRGWTLDNVLAHRQSHGGKPMDPGPDIWGNVAGWAVNELGMGWGGPDFTVGSGKTIPDVWWDASYPSPPAVAITDPNYVGPDVDDAIAFLEHGAQA